MARGSKVRASRGINWAPFIRAASLVLSARKPVAVFTPNRKRLACAMISRKARMDPAVAHSGIFSEKDWKRLEAAGAWLEGQPIWLAPSNGWARRKMAKEAGLKARQSKWWPARFRAMVTHDGATVRRKAV